MLLPLPVYKLDLDLFGIFRTTQEGQHSGSAGATVGITLPMSIVIWISQEGVPLYRGDSGPTQRPSASGVAPTITDPAASMSLEFHTEAHSDGVAAWIHAPGGGLSSIKPLRG
jgi:hypothetical protein